mmetsp:Transcript_31939/g.69927  ORF Transcript_31939/g.69927 Transcript_31939/m.69927 type:complete len:216 (+) Transcript_31939:66-713(+)
MYPDSARRSPFTDAEQGQQFVPSPGKVAAVPRQGGALPPVRISVVEKIMKGVSLLFWFSISFLGFYTIVVQSHSDRKFGWSILHDAASGCLLIVVACVGVYFELRDAYSEVADMPCCMDCAVELMQLVLFCSSAGFIAAGPWSSGDSSEQSDSVTDFAHVMTVFGFVVGLSHLCVGLLKRHLRMREAVSRVVQSAEVPTAESSASQVGRRPALPY